MNKILLIILLNFILTINCFGQFFFETNYINDTISNNVQQIPGVSSITYKSSYGAAIPTKGTFRALCIFVNIIYDQTPSADPLPTPSAYWQPDTKSSININPPTYLLDLFDTDIQMSYNGSVSRLYSESSFNQLIFLSDFMVVNIKQSQITPNAAASFDEKELMKSVINYINQEGGLITIYNHNQITDYDSISSGGAGVLKTLTPDSKLDIVNFLCRNISKTYGNYKLGDGFSGAAATPSIPIKINNSYHLYNLGTYQNIGDGNISNDKSVLEHELAHDFLGDNAFHTTGSNHYGDSYVNTFLGKQMGGYGGLFGGGLRSCNAYERWRLNWLPYTNAYPIQASDINADIISKFTGEQTFTLRDFVTYGDAIRIKLPYKDTDLSSNQYIWFENHQIGENGKLDRYSFFIDCRDYNMAGIFCYYQVGKDIIENSNLNLIYPSNEKDNLKMISAEGNYNVSPDGTYNDCLGWGFRPRFVYGSENPLSGVNDLTEVYAADSSFPKLQNYPNRNVMGSKVKNNIWYNKFPWCVDDLDPFIPNSAGVIMDISSNPPASNITTFHSVQYCNNCTVADFYASNSNKDTRKIYLTGLSIKMIDPNPSYTGMKSYTVKIRWDDYDVKRSVNWAGDIVLKEQLNLLSGKTITLEQNKTPSQIDKDVVSGYFAKPTFLTCESSSICTLQPNSSIILKEKSSFVMNNSSNLSILDGASIIVQSGCTFVIKQGSNLNILGTGKIVVKSGGYLCIESGASINLQDYSSLIVLEEGAILGANPLLFTSPSCSSTIIKTGNGSVVDYSQDVYIQNETLSASRYIGGKNIFVGNHVTTSKTFGDVLINNGANIIFDSKEILFDAGFECANGSSYEVKNH